MESTIYTDDEGNCFIQTGFNLTYNTKMKPTVDDVIDSLHNLESILKRTPAFLELKLNGAKISRTEVYVQSITEGSLREDVIIRFLMSEETCEKFEELIESIRGDTGLIKPIVTLGVGALLCYGWMNASTPDKSPQTQNFYTTNVVAIGNDAGVTAEQITQILDKISDKKSLTKEAVGVAHPIKRDSTGSLFIGEANAMTVTPEVLAEVPESYSPPEQQERDIPHSNIDIFIFASDRDKKEQGWAGIVPDLFERRLKFVLGENVNPDNLHGHRRVKADIVVHERFVQSKKRYEPSFVEVIAVSYK